MPLVGPHTHDRLKAALVAAAIEAGLLYLLISGLAMRLPAAAGEELKRFVLTPPAPPPPPPTVPAPDRRRAKEGAAAPPNLNSSATELVAPTPVIPPPLPPPVIVAPIAGIGMQPSAGNAAVPGPGPGAGGQGTGTGSGGRGDGAGSGLGEETPPRWLRGRLKDSDYPRALGDAGISGTVSVRYTVAVTGRVSDCTVTRSSGSTTLDDLTCRLIRERFRFAPSRDEDGVPVPAIIVENHSWLIDEPPPPPPTRR